ncbi:hypothetical protein CPC08DRAFT_111185 [Agrocybe pediades]|nr:hypothetical protein CPC08DRAFT_111185 [Agrocybe pediades]
MKRKHPLRSISNWLLLLPSGFDPSSPSREGFPLDFNEFRRPKERNRRFTNQGAAVRNQTQPSLPLSSTGLQCHSHFVSSQVLPHIVTVHTSMPDLTALSLSSHVANNFGCPQTETRPDFPPSSRSQVLPGSAVLVDDVRSRDIYTCTYLALLEVAGPRQGVPGVRIRFVCVHGWRPAVVHLFLLLALLWARNDNQWAPSSANCDYVQQAFICFNDEDECTVGLLVA